MVPRGGARCKGSPHAGSPFLQHHFYTASALAVDVPPGGWLQPGSRGDSLRGLVHTSPLRHRERPGGGTVATPPVYVHPAAADQQQGQLQTKNAAVVVAHNSGRVCTLSHGGCNPRNEPIYRPRYRNVCARARCSGCPHAYCTVDVGVLSTPRYRDSPLCHPNLPPLEPAITPC